MSERSANGKGSRDDASVRAAGGDSTWRDRQALSDSTLAPVPIVTPFGFSYAKPIAIPTMPPLLRKRLEFWKIKPPTFAAVFDRIYVYPLEDAPTVTKGGIELAGQTKAKLASQRGLLMKAGPKAIEQLYAHGISLGHIVVCARFSPYERTYMAEGEMHSMLLLRASEVLGSEDLQTAYDNGDAGLEMHPDGHVEYTDREGGARKRVDPEDNVEGI